VKGQQYATILVVGLALVGGAYWLGHHNGTVAERTVIDVAKEQAIDSLTQVATARAGSLTRVSADLVKLAAAAKVPHANAVVRSDSADRAATYARTVARLTLEDSQATNARLRGTLDSLIVADSVLDARFHAERDASQKRFMYDSLAMEAQAKALEGSKSALDLARQDHQAQDKIIADLKGQQPGLLHRAFHGIIIVTAAAGCGGLGTLAGPAVAIGAAVACGAAAGVWAP
jgi:hypothetical protein